MSEWFTVYSKNVEQDDLESKGRAAEAKQAIRNVGTNALPILLKRIQYQPSNSRIRFLTFLDKLPSVVWNNRLVLPLLKDKGGVAAENATGIFMILGERATPAVPELTSLMFRATDADVVHRITYCLAVIGRDGLPSLVAALQNPNLPCCEASVYWLGINAPFKFGTNAADAVPHLARLATNGSPDLAKEAIRALGRIKSAPEIAVPTLTNALRSASSEIQYYAAGAISAFGTNASCAVPLLMEASTNAEHRVRSRATNALLQIAPDVLNGHWHNSQKPSGSLKR